MADSTLPTGRPGQPPRRERWMQAQSLSQHSLDDMPRLRPDGPAATATKSPVVTRGVSKSAGRTVDDVRAPSRDDAESTSALRALRRRGDDSEATGAMRAVKTRRIDEVEATGAFKSMRNAPRQDVEGTGSFRSMKGAPRAQDVESTSRLRTMDGNRAKLADRATEAAIRHAMSLEAKAQKSQFDHVLQEDLKTMVLMIVGAFCVSLVVAVMLAMAT